MTPHTFSAKQWLPYPIELAFAFFANPENLPRLMPRWQRAHIDQAIFAPPPPRPPATPHLPGLVAGTGTRMTLTFRALPLVPLRLPWDALITEFGWNDHFCDVIAGRGPFKSWKHCHHLRSTPDPTGTSTSPGTLLSDHVEYALPFGLLGSIANAIVVRQQIVSIFRFRHRKTAELLPQFAASTYLR